MATKLTPEEEESYKQTFALFDKDNNGEIDANELGEVMRSLGLNPTDKELTDMVNEIDVDQTGTIDLQEFLKMMTFVASTQDSEDELRQAFNVFDRDGNGTINISELREVLKALGENLTPAEINDILHVADTDGDGTISFEEFKKIMTDI